MRERDIHNLIEQQDPEFKQRVWERVSAQLDLPSTPPQKVVSRQKPLKWAAIAVALICVVTLSIVLPITLHNNDPKLRYCDFDSYTMEESEQTLKQYAISHGDNILYVDWYDNADEVTTKYGYNNEDKSDIFFFTETFINGETGESLSFSVTDNKIRVDIFDNYYLECITFKIQNINVQYRDWRTYSRAMFEYQNHIYYLQIDVGDAQERLTEIVESMLK